MNIQEISDKKIENVIYEVRGKQVMLDSDLAKLYQCKGGTKDINKAVKRNLERFPEDFYFQLTKDEYINLKFQNGTSSYTYGGVRKMPYVFTEQGVAMLSSVLRTNVAAEVSVCIMRAFVAMRRYLLGNHDIYWDLNHINGRLNRQEEMILEHHSKINELFNKFDNESPKELTYYDGQFYDATSIISIMKKAKKELIIVDSYADETVLDMISKLKIPVILIVKKNGYLSKAIIEKYNKQYNNLKVIFNDKYHDRYFILDRMKVFHSGTSINYAGSKVFSIHLFEDEDTAKIFVDKIVKIVERGN